MISQRRFQQGMGQQLVKCPVCVNRTFNSVYATHIVPEKEVGRWDTKQIIVSGPIGKEDLPVLPTGRNFMRLKGDKKDFLITWETA